MMKAAVIGAGRMGLRHVVAARAVPMEVVGVCDRRPEALARAAADLELPGPSLFRDPAEMMRVIRPECVIVATTAASHGELTRLAAEAGARYVLCEKPMATSLEECQRMLEVCEREGVRLASNHQLRFMPAYAEAKRIVDSAGFGGLGSINVIGGNGGLAMVGAHYFELLRFISGEPAAEVSAWLAPERVPNPRGPEFEDRAGSIRATTAGGKRLYLDLGADQGHGLKIVYGGRYGQLVVDVLAGRMELSTREAAHRSEPLTRYTLPSVVDRWEITPVNVVEPTRALLVALIAGDGYPTGEDGRAAVAGIVAAHVSDEAGHCPVAIDRALPADRVFPWA
jgi:predicted dehydrogenase